MDNGALGHVAANLHRQFVPPSAMGPEEAGFGGHGASNPVLYVATKSAPHLYDANGDVWDRTTAAGWARYCKAYACTSQGTLLSGQDVLNIELPFPVAGSGVLGVRQLGAGVILRYVVSDGLQSYGADTMDGFCLDAPLGNDVPWHADACIGIKTDLWLYENGPDGLCGYPTGWHKCDGSTGIGKGGTRSVPDLRNKFLFVEGANPVGHTAGSVTHNHAPHNSFSVEEGTTGVIKNFTPELDTHDQVDHTPEHYRVGIIMWVGVTGF